METHDAAVAQATARGPRLTRAGRELLGRRLAMRSSDRRSASRAAESNGMSPRWMRELRGRARRGHVERGPGRPRIHDAERERVRSLVAEQRAAQGEGAGVRPMLRALRAKDPEISETLVREALAALKLRARSARRRAIEAARETVEILGRDTVWGQDTTHLGRLESGEEVTGELVRDRATLATVSLSVGGPVTARDVAADLRRAASERGGFPLVRQHDNASVYEAKEVVELAAAERMVLMRSRVHTPTDNAAAEHGHGEYKGETGLGRGVVLRSQDEAAARLAAAREALDGGLRRATRGWHTADELDRLVPRADACVDRDAFYAAARAAVAAAVLGHDDPRAARAAEREAIITTLWGRRSREGSVPTPFQPTQKE